MTLGEKLLFGSSGNAVRFLGRGWDQFGSDEGRWSVDHVADFLFELSPPPQSDMTLDIEMLPFVRAPQLVASRSGFTLTDCGRAFSPPGRQ
jgi:hypothetical protein